MRKQGRQSSPEDYSSVPMGVWVFWAIAGMLLLGFLASRFVTFSSALDTTIRVIAALGAAAAAWAAYLTVRELRHERSEERFYRRPYFSFIEGEIGKALDDEAQYGESEYIRIKCRQVGTNPATLLTVTASILMPVDNGFVSPVVVDFRPVNDVASGFDSELNRGGLFLADRTQHHYVVLELEYFDAIFNFRFNQTFYLQWNGLDPYNESDTSDRLYSITREVKPYVLSMLKDM